MGWGGVLGQEVGGWEECGAGGGCGVRGYGVGGGSAP